MKDQTYLEIAWLCGGKAISSCRNHDDDDDDYYYYYYDDYYYYFDDDMHDDGWWWKMMDDDGWWWKMMADGSSNMHIVPFFSETSGTQGFPCNFRGCRGFVADFLRSKIWVDRWMMANSHVLLLKAWTLETSFVSSMSEEFRRKCENLGFPIQISRMIFVLDGGWKKGTFWLKLRLQGTITGSRPFFRNLELNSDQERGLQEGARNSWAMKKTLVG